MPFRDEEAITAQKIKLKLESLTKLSNSNVCSDFMSDCEKKKPLLHTIYVNIWFQLQTLKNYHKHF